MQNLITSIQYIPKDKKVFVFDLDGTLAESKVNIDGEMGELLAQLLVKDKVAIIGGASFEQMKSQLPENISQNSNLLLLPLDGGSFYEFQNNEWQEVYKHDLSLVQRKVIREAFAEVLLKIGYVQPEKTYGVIIEDRGSQTTWSALGQQAPLEEKKKWNKEENGLRLKIVAKLREYLPDTEARVAGLTSINVTLKGIDKKFGIEQIIKRPDVLADDVLFIGDELGVDGNDNPALSAGVDCFQVSSIDETKALIKHFLD